MRKMLISVLVLIAVLSPVMAVSVQGGYDTSTLPQRPPDPFNDNWPFIPIMPNPGAFGAALGNFFNLPPTMPAPPV
jgi:hypothetical protein